MARTAGLSAWEEYFSGKGDFEAQTKNDVALRPYQGSGAAPRITKGTKVKFLGSLVKTKQDYLSYANVKKGKPISPKINAWLPIEYKGKKYLCDIDSLAKPTKSGNVDLSLQTANLLESAPSKKVDLFGESNVQSAVFTSAKDLAATAKSYIKKNRLLDGYPNLKKSIEQYFDSGNYAEIKWVQPITDFEIAQFAKYIGEICIGLVALSAKTTAIEGTNPFVGKKTKKMIYPMSQSFKGADSVAELGDGIMIPISSKAGAGAAASFFGNLFLMVLQNEAHRPSRTVLKKLYDAAISVGVRDETSMKTGAKKIVYEYGIRNICGLSKTQVPDTYQVFTEFKAYDKFSQYSSTVKTAYKAIEQKMRDAKDTLAIQKLDESTTVFFCKKIAEEMNNDPKTMDIITKLLGQKPYYQVNLDVPKLRKGNLSFKIVKAEGGSVQITGGKSSYNNIDASQGTLNYRIK